MDTCTCQFNCMPAVPCGVFFIYCIFENFKAVVYRRQNAVPVSQMHLEPEVR